MEQWVRWFTTLSYVAPLLLLGVVAAAFAMFSDVLADPTTPAIAKKLAGLNRKIIVFVLFVVSLPIVMTFIMRPFRHRLGTDGLQLFVRLADGRQVVLSPDRLIYDSWKIASRGYIFPIRSANGRLLYESGEVARYIEPLLYRAKKVSGIEMLRHQLSSCLEERLRRKRLRKNKDRDGNEKQLTK
jgi:hypothetical protein